MLHRFPSKTRNWEMINEVALNLLRAKEKEAMKETA
jgi:hypothetical protein